MLSGRGKLGWGRKPDAVDVERLLRLEAAEARVEPTADLRRRTLAALRAASLQPALARRGPRAFTYAAACGALALLASAAVLHLGPSPTVPSVPPRGGAGLVAVKLPRLDRVESPLKAEIRMLLADARQARDSLLASLPRPPRGG
jgi:hypothetical protein